MRRDRVEEAFRNIEAPEVLEAVQQPVGVGGIAARLELSEPDEPRHAGVGRLFEQMLEVAPKPGRDPLGDARFDPALRGHQRVGAEPLDRRRFRFFAEPVCELTRRAAREGPESVQAAQLSKMLVPGLGPDRGAVRRGGERPGAALRAGAGARERLRAVPEALVPAATEPAAVTSGGGEIVLPQVIVEAGPLATARFLEFFAGRIANARTRAAYGRAVGQFLGWCEARGLGLRDVSPLHVAAYIRTHPGSAPTVKQHLAAIRMLGDWLVVSQVLPVNPAAAVRGQKHVVTKGATPVLSSAEARKLLESIDTGALVGLRDRALLSVMLYSFARVSAVLGMRRQDYFGQGSRGWLRLHEKGGKRHDVPAHHRAAAALGAYVEAAGLDEPKAALFQTVDPTARRLTGRALERRLVLAMCLSQLLKLRRL